jgi:ABC-2 type transport system ATP-binding protein
LSDVETMCDRVAILRKGEVVVSGRLSELLRSDVRRTDIALLDASPEFERECAAAGHALRRVGARLVIEIEGEAKVPALLRRALELECVISEVTPRHETLEDLFVREAIDA